MTSASSSDLKFVRPATVNNLGTNGGKPSKLLDNTLFANGLLQIDPTQRQQANNILRKCYYGTVAGDTANPDNELSFGNARVACSKFYTPDFIICFLTQGATLEQQFEAKQSDIPVLPNGMPNTRLYGVAYLTQSASLGDTSVVIDALRGDLQTFQAGDFLSFSRSRWRTTAGSSEWILTADSTQTWFEGVSATAVTYAGNIATIQLSQPLNYDIPKNSFVSTTLIFSGDITNHAGEVVVTRGNTSTGTYSDTASPIKIHPLGGVAQRWTLSFVNSTAFNLIGDTLGTVASGSISSDFAPVNPKNNKPYFTLPSAGFSGTWQAGDTVTFYSFTQMLPFWVYAYIPANTPAATTLFNVVANN